MTSITVSTRRDREIPYLATVLRGLIAALRRGYGQYKEDRLRRAAFLNLMTLDDAMLDDIGLTRDEVIRAARLPLEVDAARALHERARSRVGPCMSHR